MIGHLRGVVLRCTPPELLLDVGGVGYELTVPLRTAEKMSRERGEIELEVVTSLRNEALELYGFESTLDKRLFGMLTGVSGVGAKLALAVLSALDPAALVEALRAEDPAPLEAVPGIGRKTARRIVIDLKEKALAEYAEVGPAPGAPDTGDAVAADALLALERLGYRRQEAERALSRLRRKQPETDLAGLIRGALRQLGSQ